MGSRELYCCCSRWLRRRRALAESLRGKLGITEPLVTQ